MSNLERRGFGVTPSPLNGVKLELGIVLCLALVLWLLVGRWVTSVGVQVLLLGGYSLAGMVWLVVRTRRVVRRAGRDGEHGFQSPLAR